MSDELQESNDNNVDEMFVIVTGGITPVAPEPVNPPQARRVEISDVDEFLRNNPDYWNHWANEGGYAGNCYMGE